MVAGCAPGFQLHGLCNMPEVRGLFRNNESLSVLPPAYPTFSFASAPTPPPPFPVGRGDYKLILPGASPPAPRHQTVYGTDSPCRCSTPEGGLPSWSPAAPAFSWLFCPLHRRGRIDSPAPIPLPALAERSSQREGGDYKLILPGAPPPAPRHQTVYGTDSPCRRCAQRAACVLVAGSPATATPGGVGQTKRGP